MKLGTFLLLVDSLSIHGQQQVHMRLVLVLKSMWAVCGKVLEVIQHHETLRATFRVKP